MDLNYSPLVGPDEDGVPCVGNPLSFCGPALVAYLDVLGFSRMVRLRWSTTSDSPLNRILRIKKAPLIQSPDQGVMVSADSRGRPLCHYRLRVQSVFDAVIIAIALPTQGNVLDLCCSIGSVLFHIKLIYEAAIKEGFVLRGGLEFGDLYWDQSDIIGPALVDVYGIESVRASCARVLVGPRVLHLIRESAKSESSALQYINSAILSLFRFCDDELIAWDPGCLVRGKSDKSLINQVEELRRKASSQYQRVKYDWLLSVLRAPQNDPWPDIESLRKVEEMLLDSAT